MWQEVSKLMNNEKLAESTERKELTQVSKQELDNTSAFCGNNVKEKPEYKPGYLAGKSHEGIHNDSLKKVEIGYAAIEATTGLARTGKKRCRDGLEGEAVLPSNTVDEKSGSISFSENLALNLSDVPNTGQEPGVESCKQMRCHVCDIFCNGKTSLQAHFAGKKHALKLKSSTAKVATSCLNETKTRIVDAENGNNKEVPEASNYPHSGPIRKKLKAEEQKEFSCGICNIKCNSQKHLDFHFLGKKHASHLKKLSPFDAASNGAYVTFEKNHALKGNISTSAASECLNTVLFGDSGTNPTGCDLHKIALGGYSAGYLKALLHKGGPAGGVKAWIGGVMDDFVCSGAQMPTVDALAELKSYQVIAKGICNLQASASSKISEDKVEIEKEHILYELCGMECGNEKDGHIIVKMHPTCLLKLLTTDRNACSGTAGAILGCRKEREKTLQMNSLGGGPPSQPVSTLDGEVQEECKLCQVKCGNRKDLDTHLIGKKHAIQLKKSVARCEVCNVYCGTSKGLMFHKAGKKHASKVRLAQGKGDFSSMHGLMSGNAEDALKFMTGGDLVIKPMNVQEYESWNIQKT